ncbi:MAG: fatty acid desaturase [Candidatus Sericytochromatia bacterium]|nr:fatty acid desaturase [Candidatus Sericytochromatia bacterium]
MEIETYQTFAQRFVALKSSNGSAGALVLRVVLLTVTAIALTIFGSTAAWLAGQALMAVAIMQWFFLLHDSGHRHFFATPALNTLVGHVASVFCLVPFTPWRTIHGQHHLWTGWHDLDPTQAGVTLGDLPRAQRVLVDVCWAAWIPLFTVAFGAINFWNLPRCVRRFSRDSREAWHHAFSMAVPLVAHGALFWFLGPAQAMHVYGLGMAGFFVLSDPLLLSQHSHMPERLADGEPVFANKLWDQDDYTRSIVFPRWASRHLLFHFDVHIVHHLFPNLPSYLVGQVQQEVGTVNTIDWWSWLKQAKRTPAHILLFSTRQTTGFDF